ncbi:PREDICTED: GDSL esterase/lipase At3g09930-like isoform X4 [Nelumbo nucifera]|uniref:GDSL esterase/lipase At3g09930-like isoform X4 n=1 Tax=Nelumbo nucifera TaxID=4432 RepID=A0A1U7ZAV3_NELNU|nr:PREDICTED: GDSL esterase/lipase At3g09930-like isoform X4 [Nelumbo nucifera]
MGNHNAYILCLHLFSFLVLLTACDVAGTQVVQSSSHHQNHHSRYRQVGLSKLFVFGDSYADTGNNPKSVAKSWHEPYGITFPGRPTGRWSDGRVLTDYVASFIGIKSPIAYKWIKFGPKLLSNGINFAYGGTGVFNTLAPQPNMTTQINFFQKIIQTGVYSKRDLDSSLALVSLAGNDYGAYNARSGTAQAVQQLNNEVKNSTFLLDLHSAFMSVFKKRNSSGNVKFSNPLQPCCVGMDASNSCGSTDQLSGKKKYRVCKHPKAAFFWDLLHPSQAGWHAVSLVLHSSFNKLYS